MPDPTLVFDYLCARFGIDPRDERGMTTTEVAVVTFLLVGAAIVVMGIIYTAAKANAAAAEAVDAAQVETGTAGEGEAAATSYLDQSGNLTNVTVVVNREPTLVTAEVRGEAPQLVPGFSWSVTARSQAPVERFI